MNARLALAMLGIVAATMLWSAAPSAQVNGALRREIERRFDVLPLREGLALRPKSDARGIRSIELTGGTIAIDGQPVTGAELRDRLGSDADSVIRLSYLDPSARRRLFGLAPEAGGRPETGNPPAVPSPPEVAAPPAVPSPPAVPTPPADANPPEKEPARTRRSDSLVRVGGSVTVDEDEIVEGDVVVIGGDVTVNGQVTGDVVAIGGSIRLGPHADIGKDVATIGSSIRRARGARVGGKVNEIGPGRIGLSGWRIRRGPFWTRFGGPWAFGSLFALMSTMARLIVLCVCVSIVMLIGRDYVERVGARAAAEPVKAGLVGVLAQLLFVPLLIMSILVLVVTIIGIPLLALIPFALLGLVIILLVGFSAVAFDVGRLVTARLGWSSQSPYATAIIGIVAVLSPLLAARLIGLAGGGLLFPLALALLALGLLCEYLAWTVGFGAVALLRFDKGSPPPAPAVSEAPSSPA